ncbi:MAG: S-layer homology domain-containing protein [Clostridia bacterium]|nr:S-layer homology domain-containing protein [Clostridia bacterium]
MKRKIVLRILAAAVLAALLPLGVFAAATETVVNVTAVNGRIVGSSTVYAGEVFLDGQSVLTYVYSDDITRSETVVAAARDGFGGPDDDGFAALFPNVIGEEGTGIAECSDAALSAEMDANWKDAAYVAGKYYPDKTIGSSESRDMFLQDEAFAARCRSWWEGVGLYNEAGEDFEMCGPLGKLSSSFTDTVTFTVIDGKLLKLIDRVEDYTLESITVIYTAAYLKSDPSVIENVEVAVTPPKAGQKSLETSPVVTVNGTDCEIDSASWLPYLSGYTTEELDVTFEEGGTYYVYVLLKAKDGMTFDKGEAVSNGIDEGFSIFDGCTVTGGELKFAASRTFDLDAFKGDYMRLKIAVTATAAGGLPCTGGDDCPGRTFLDMPPKGNWAHDPIDWAVAKGITTGTSSTTFSPEEGCTRGQVVTFLWRAAGQPEPTITNNPFKDVKADDYFYKAVMWAVEKEVTTGTSATAFSPDDVCTRGQIVTFLWRANGKPAPSKTSNPFKDVKSGDYFYSAVLWAVERGITLGTDATHFSPSDTCTRGQVVTFLYRSANK